VIPKECKRLAEVDFPIAVVSRHSSHEKKSPPRGHPSTLHVWWARRPLGACRAVLLALLLPDPCDERCPEGFKVAARALLASVQGRPGGANEDLQKALLKFIGDFSNWDLSANQQYLSVGRGLVRAAHGMEPPLVVDPFAGGGSIPLEALRLGCDAFATDLNPVAGMILKVLLEDIQRHGSNLADGLRKQAAEIKRSVESELAPLYPVDPDGAKPVGYLWARTVRCEAPNCGAEIPLVRSFWLCKKERVKRALRARVARGRGVAPRVEFEIFEPRREEEVAPPTVTRARGTCLCCGTVLASDRVRAQLTPLHGGADPVFDERGRRIGGARLLAVITSRDGEAGRHYRLSTERDYEAVWKAGKQLGEAAAKSLPQGLSLVPNESTPKGGGSGAGRAFSVYPYGMTRWGDLFTARQKLTLVTLSRQIALLYGRSGEDQEAQAVAELLAFALNVFARSCNSGARLRPDSSVAPAFGMQTLPVTWTFPETVPWGTRAEHFEGSVRTVVGVLEAGSVTVIARSGQVQLADARDLPLPQQSCDVWFTDPPYYDAVPYADLSDFFFVWLRRALVGHPMLVNPFEPGAALTPKSPEIVQDETKRTPDGRPKDKAYFEASMHEAFAQGCRVLREDGVACVVFAHKTTEGWEALLSGMIRAGWTITGSWPIATESATRLRARDSAALATSVHLLCRPRLESASVGDWAVVLRELPPRVGDWMERLQREGVRGADLVFACVGPALEIFSRYTKVETADGREVTLAEYLEKVWEVVGRSALAQVLGTAEGTARNGAAGAVEEDARLTALFLWTLQSTHVEAADDAEGEDQEASEEDEDEEGSSSGKAKGFTLVFDVVRRFAQPLGIELPRWEGRIIETKKGVVRLLPIAERAKQLFGEDGAQAVAARLEREAMTPNPLQGMLFPDVHPAAPRVRGRGRGKRAGGDVSDESLAAAREATTLDGVHAAMLLQAGGRTNALRALLKAEQERSPDFLRLANALSALYPKGSEEKRLLEAMLLAAPRS
jgi:putative DNA methylase